MDRKLFIGAAVLILLLLGTGGYFLTSRQSAPSQNQAVQTQSTQEVQPLEKKSLIDLINFSGNQQCSFKDSESKTSGTVYVSSGKLRGDFESTIEGQTTLSHMVSDGSNVYIWMDDQTQGFKMSLEKLDQFKDGANQQSIDINKQIDYLCSGWTEDPVKFTLPTEIKFKDFSVMIPSTTVPGSANPQDPKAAQCASCESLPEEAQAQCKKALSCN